MSDQARSMPSPVQIEFGRVLVPMKRILDRLDGEDLRFCAKHALLLNGKSSSTSNFAEEEVIKKLVVEVIQELAENDIGNFMLLSNLLDIVYRIRVAKKAALLRTRV